MATLNLPEGILRHCDRYCVQRVLRSETYLAPGRKTMFSQVRSDDGWPDWARKTHRGASQVSNISNSKTWHGISMSGCSWWWILWRAPWFGPSHQRFLSLLRDGACILGVAYSWSDKTRLNIEHVKPFIHLYIICWGKKCSIILACFTALLSVNWPITSTGLNFKHHVSRFWDDTVQWINQVHWSGVGVSGWVLNHVNHHFFCHH